MSKELNKLLEKAYHRWKNEPDAAPIPVELIREFLKDEGIDVNAEDNSGG